MELLEALRARHARAGARPPGADRRSVERLAAGRVAGGAGAGSTPAGSRRRRSASSPGITTPTSRRWWRRATFEKLFAPYMTHDLAPRAERTTRRLSLRPAPRRRRVRRRLQLGADRRLSAPGARSATRSSRGSRRCSAAPELAGKTRVVLVHHPPVRHKHGERAQPPRPRRAGGGARARRRGAGAARPRPPGRARRARRGRAGEPIPVIGGGSASYTGSARAALALQPLRDRGRAASPG